MVHWDSVGNCEQISIDGIKVKPGQRWEESVGCVIVNAVLPINKYIPPNDVIVLFSLVPIPFYADQGRSLQICHESKL